MKTYGLIMSVIGITAGAAVAEVHNVRQFGAAGDGQTKDTPAIQKAIDAAATAGGGTVFFPAGRYLSGTLYLKSLVTLRLEAGATLLGSTDLDDYPELIPKFPTLSLRYVCRSIIYGENLHDIAIVGRGTIDGQGGNEIWKRYRDSGPRKRPYNIRITSCRNIRIEGVTLRNSAMWMQHYLDCENVLITGITVDNRSINNNDGLDIDCCKNVRISDCYIHSIDDAICLKSTGERICENVVITNCITTNHTNGVKMGTEGLGGFRNVTVSNCAMYDCGMSAVTLLIVDGGILDGVTVTNLALNHVDTPFFIRLGDRGRTFEGRPKPPIGTLRNVIISNIVAVDADVVGASIHGLPGHPVRNVSLSNLRLTYRGGGTRQDAQRTLPELEAEYPEHSMFGTMPAYGLYCRHVDGLTMENVQVGWAKPDVRPALRCEDVRNLRIGSFQGMTAPDGEPTIVLQDVQNALLTGCMAAPDTSIWLNLLGQASGISVLANDLSTARNAFALPDGLGPDVLFEQANRLSKQRPVN